MGLLLSIGYHGRWTIPLAAWLAPVALLHFMRLEPPLTGFLLLWLGLWLAYGIANRGVMPMPSLPYTAVFAAIALLPALAFLADRLVSPDWPGFSSTLVLPATWVTLEFGGSRFNPFGTWGSLGYSQAGALPLLQLVSVTGVSGVSFVIVWFASVTNWAWDHHLDWSVIGPGIITFATVIAALLLGGGARLMRARPGGTTMRVAGIGWPGVLEQREVVQLYRSPLELTDLQRGHLRQAFLRTTDRFLEDTRREARAGARIVVWPEASALVFTEDEPTYLARARALARSERIFLLLGMGTIHAGQRLPMENKAVLIDPAGEMRSSYLKITAAGGEAAVNRRGTTPVPTVDTHLGRLSTPICFDMDFPLVIRPTGRARSDLLLVPASDWPAIGRLHLAMAIIRAIENGTAMLRVTRWGHSGATDPYGRILAFMDDFTTTDRAMIALVPLRAGVRTVYARWGDWFGWLCTAGTAILLIRHFAS